MGYYDHDYQSEATSKRHKSRRGGWFWAGLVGAIFGVLVAFVATPVLAKYDVLPYGSENAAENTVSDEQMNSSSATSDKPSGTNTTMNVDVNTETSKAVNKISGAVVGVVNYQKANLQGPFGGSQGDAQGGATGEAQPRGQGSGVIYKKEDGHAYIVTNHHVVKGANKIEVTFDKDTKVAAQLVGSDKWMDLAVLKIKADKVKNVAELGSSKSLKVGEPVVAIGNALGFAGSVTQGIVSATNRTVPRDVNGDKKQDWQAEVLQTDAAINPGNSGGALINMDGQVIGINSMKIAQQAVEGIGFAIPIDVVKPLIDEIEKHGSVQRPFMGIAFQDLSRYPSDYRKQAFNLPSKVKSGVIIRSIVPNGPADDAGMEPGDVIVSMDGDKIKDVLSFRKRLFQGNKPGDQLKVGLYRNGKKKSFEIKLGRQSK